MYLGGPKPQSHALRPLLEGDQSHQKQGERRPGHRGLDPVEREIALPSRLPVRSHRLWVPWQHHVVVRAPRT